MLRYNANKCSKCGGGLKYYDSVKRILRGKRGITRKVLMRRFKCIECNSIHREIPPYLLPYKQYEKEIIIGVQNGTITKEMLDYEDYPCESTMIRWKKTT